MGYLGRFLCLILGSAQLELSYPFPKGFQWSSWCHDRGYPAKRPPRAEGARAIGHRDEIGRKRRQALDGVPQAVLHLRGLGREELERDRGRLQRVVAVWRGNLGHDTTNSTGNPLGTDRTALAAHSLK